MHRIETLMYIKKYQPIDRVSDSSIALAKAIADLKASGLVTATDSNTPTGHSYLNVKLSPLGNRLLK